MLQLQASVMLLGGLLQRLRKWAVKLLPFLVQMDMFMMKKAFPGEKIEYLLEMRASGADKVSVYADKFPSAKFFPGEKSMG